VNENPQRVVNFEQLKVQEKDAKFRTGNGGAMHVVDGDKHLISVSGRIYLLMRCDYFYGGVI